MNPNNFRRWYLILAVIAPAGVLLAVSFQSAWAQTGYTEYRCVRCRGLIGVCRQRPTYRTCPSCGAEINSNFISSPASTTSNGYTTMDDPESKAYTAFIGAAILIGLILGAYHFMKR